MVKKIFENSVRKGGSILFDQQKTILSGAVVISVMFLVSAILGLVKKRLYVSVITAGPEYDVLVAAFSITDVLFQLLIVGSVNAAFIPIFSSHISTKGREESWKFVSTVLNLTVVLFTVLAAVLFVGARFFGSLFFSGFSADQLDQFVQIMRILLLSPLFLGFSSFVAGTLQAFKRFFMPFLSPVLYNVGAIFGIVVLYPLMGVTGAVWGVVIGAMLHLLIQLPALKYLGFSYHLILDLKDKFIKSLVTLSFPRTIGIGVEQIKTLVMLNIASFLPHGSISFLDLGQSIVSIPISLVGISIATASFPQFTELFVHKDYKALKNTFLSSLNQILFFIMPFVVILIVLKIPVVRLIYGSSSVRFPWEDTLQTAWVVAFLAVGMAAISINHLMIRLYYAQHNTITPVIAGIVGVVTSIVIAAILVEKFSFGVGALAISISLGAVLESLILIASLVRSKFVGLVEIFVTPLKILTIGAIMGVSIYVPVKALDQVFIDTSRVVNLVILMWLVTSFGATLYLFLSWVLDIRELKQVLSILVKIRDFKSSVVKQFSQPRIIPQNFIDE